MVASSRISLFLCRRSGRSLMSWSIVWRPPCRITLLDFSKIDCGILSPEISSMAAGKFKEARILQYNKKESLCYTSHNSLLFFKHLSSTNFVWIVHLHSDQRGYTIYLLGDYIIITKWFNFTTIFTNHTFSISMDSYV